MEQDNWKRNGEWLKEYTEAKEDIRYYGKWKVDSSKYPTVKISDVYEEIDSGMSDFVDYVTEHSKYDINYVLSVSMVEFYAIIKRIDNRLAHRAAQLQNKK